MGGHPSLFFPEKGGNAYGEAQAAKDVCNGVQGSPCPVRDECLEWALVNNEGFGVWGGLSERERRRLRQERRLNAPEVASKAKRAATQVRRSG